MIYNCTPLIFIATVDYISHSFIPNDFCHLLLRLLFVSELWLCACGGHMCVHIIVLHSQSINVIHHINKLGYVLEIKRFADVL